MPKNNKERQAELKARREAEGKVKRPYWATPDEHNLLKDELCNIRQQHKRNPHGLYALYLKNGEWRESATVKNTDLEK